MTQKYPSVDCSFCYFFDQARTWQHRYPSPAFFTVPLPASFVRTKRQQSIIMCESTALEHATGARTNTQPFPSLWLRSERWGLGGGGGGRCVCVCVCVCVCRERVEGGALLLLVTVCFPPPQSICLLRLSTPSPQRERNLISLRGTELKDTETLRRCIYLCKAVSLSWLIWISNFGPCCYYIL